MPLFNLAISLIDENKQILINVFLYFCYLSWVFVLCDTLFSHPQSLCLKHISFLNLVQLKLNKNHVLFISHFFLVFILFFASGNISKLDGLHYSNEIISRFYVFIITPTIQEKKFFFFLNEDLMLVCTMFCIKMYLFIKCHIKDLYVTLLWCQRVFSSFQIKWFSQLKFVMDVVCSSLLSPRPTKSFCK